MLHTPRPTHVQTEEWDELFRVTNVPPPTPATIANITKVGEHLPDQGLEKGG